MYINEFHITKYLVIDIGMFKQTVMYFITKHVINFCKDLGTSKEKYQSI